MRANWKGLPVADFDEKGDVTTQTAISYVRRGGTYVPLE
jgi:hypothetical protein